MKESTHKFSDIPAEMILMRNVVIALAHYAYSAVLVILACTTLSGKQSLWALLFAGLLYMKAPDHDALLKDE